MGKFLHNPSPSVGWVVIGDAPRINRQRRYLARCNGCGVEKQIDAYTVNAGKSRGCPSCRNAFRTHGQASSSTYKSWEGLIQRCTNPKSTGYMDYGGRGVEVCERWRSFENFLADMGERPVGTSIDRVDVNGNYEPTNCRWTTAKEQAANKRPSRKRRGSQWG